MSDDAQSYPDFVRSLFAPAATMRPNFMQEATEFPEEAGAALALSVESSSVMDELKRILAYGKEYSPGTFGLGQLGFTALLDEDLVPPARFDDLEDWEVEFLHAAVGLFTEAGELMEQVHSRVCLGEPMDRENLNEEVGDSGFYLQAAINVLTDHLGQSHPQDGNVEKLRKRYPGGSFDAGDAMSRADKGSGDGKTVTITISEAGPNEIDVSVESNRDFPDRLEDATFPEKVGIACMRFIRESLMGEREKEQGVIVMPRSVTLH